MLEKPWAMAKLKVLTNKVTFISKIKLYLIGLGLELITGLELLTRVNQLGILSRNSFNKPAQIPRWLQKLELVGNLIVKQYSELKAIQIQNFDPLSTWYLGSSSRVSFFRGQFGNHNLYNSKKALPYCLEELLYAQ